MQNQFELPVLIKISPSSWLVLWIYLIHLGAIPTVIFSGLQTSIQLVLILLILTSLIMTRRKYINLTSPVSVLQVMLNGSDEWWLTTADNRTFKAELMPAALVHPILTVMCFQSNSGIFPVILSPDASQCDDLRRLRVRLKFRRKTGRLDDEN